MKYLLAFFSFVVLGIAVITGANYYFDIYGLRGNIGRPLFWLSSQKAYIVPAKMSSTRDVYLLGSSRLLYLNPRFIEKISGKRVANFAHSAINFQTITAELEALHTLHPNRRVIIGLDPFITERDRMAKGYNINAQKAVYLKYNFPYFNADMLYFTAKTYLRLALGGKDMTEYESSTAGKVFNKDLEKTRANIKKAKLEAYKNYTIDNALLAHFTKALRPQDIVVVFPKYYYYSCLAVRSKTFDTYFRAISYILEHSEAKVISFYGISALTKFASNYDGFKGSAWHFLPKIGYSIFADIYKNSPPKYGVWLSRENIASYVKSTRTEVLEYCKAHEKDLEE